MHSTRERLSSYWGQIKDFLFAPIEEEVGSLTNKQQQLITALKDEFGGTCIRVRGHIKIMAHLMFGILALTAYQLMRFVA